MLLVEERHQLDIIQTLSSSSKGLAYWTCLQGLDYHHRKCIIGEYASKHHHLHHYHGISSLDIAIRDKTSSSLLCTCVLTSSSSSFSFFVSLQTVYCSCKRETQNILKQQPSVEDSDLFWCKMRTVYELKKKALIMDCHLFKISDCLYDRTPKNYDCWICCHMKFCLHEI